jgi:hypothetical protein
VCSTLLQLATVPAPEGMFAGTLLAVLVTQTLGQKAYVDATPHPPTDPAPRSGSIDIMDLSVDVSDQESTYADGEGLTHCALSV